MAEVKMSLKEYNQLYEELSQLKAALRSLLTPSLSSYEKNNFVECAEDGGTFTFRSTFRLDNPFIARLIQEKYEDLIESEDLDPDTFKVDFDYFSDYSQNLNLFRLDFPHPNTCRHCGDSLEDTKRYCSEKAYCSKCCEHCKEYKGGNCYYYKKAHPVITEED